MLLLIYVLCKLWIVRLGWFYIGCSCANFDGVLGVCVLCYLSLCLEVCRLSTLWLVLASCFYYILQFTNPIFAISYILLILGFLWRFVGSCLYSQPTFLLVFMILFYLKDNIFWDLCILFHCRIYIINMDTWQPGFRGII